MTRQALSGPAPGFQRKPDYAIELRPVRKRVLGMAGGLAVVESRDALAMIEGDSPPVWYFPRSDIRMDLLTRTDTRTHCPFKGDASYWALATPAGERSDAVWSYEAPFDEMAAIAGRIAFYWDALERWSEDGDERCDSPSIPAA